MTSTNSIVQVFGNDWIGLDSGSVVLVHRVPPPLVLRADPHHPPHLLHPTPWLIVRQVIFAVLAFLILLLHLFLSKNHVHDLLPHTISCFRLCGLQTVWTKIKKKWYLFLVLLLQVFQVILYSPITPNGTSRFLSVLNWRGFS